MEDYSQYFRWVGAHLTALQRAGFSIWEIRNMTREERLELGAMALEDERKNPRH